MHRIEFVPLEKDAPDDATLAIASRIWLAHGAQVPKKMVMDYLCAHPNLRAESGSKVINEATSANVGRSLAMFSRVPSASGVVVKATALQMANAAAAFIAGEVQSANTHMLLDNTDNVALHGDMVEKSARGWAKKVNFQRPPLPGKLRRQLIEIVRASFELA